MPEPVVEPRPLPSREFRPPAPEDAQDASYFAASARIASFRRKACLDLNVHGLFITQPRCLAKLLALLGEPKKGGPSARPHRRDRLANQEP